MSDKDIDLELESILENKKSVQPKKRQVKPKVCSEWSDNEVFKLISCVECVPMLWNAKDEKYRNKVERQSAWKQIAEVEFNEKYKDVEVMAKWSNMRIQYPSYFAKYRKTKSGQGANNIVKWKFYEAMDFVGRAEDEQISTTVSNLVNGDEESLDFLFDQSSTSTPTLSKCKQQSSQSSSFTTTSSSAAHIVAEGMRDAVNQLKKQRRNCEDEFEAFGKYVASELRSLCNPNSARRVRFKVARCLMNFIEAENQSTGEFYFYEQNPIDVMQEPSV